MNRFTNSTNLFIHSFGFSTCTTFFTTIDKNFVCFFFEINHLPDFAEAFNIMMVGSSNSRHSYLAFMVHEKLLTLYY